MAHDERVIEPLPKLLRKERKFEKVSRTDEGVIPERKTKHSAAYDLVLIDDVILRPNEYTTCPLGIKVCMPDDEYFQISVRSGIGKQGIGLLTGIGVVDSDYYNNPDNEGEIALTLINYRDSSVCLRAGSGVAQGIFHKYLITDDDKATGVRVGGFGSTGCVEID